MTVRTDLLSTFPDTVATAIKTVLPELAECKGIAGRFNLRRLMQESVKSPGVLVSILRVKWDDTNSEISDLYFMEMAAFVVTADALGLPRDTAASSICQKLAQIIPNNRFGDPDCGEAVRLAVEPIVDADLQSAKAGLWAVTWQQPCILKAQAQPAPLPIELYVGQPPNTGAANLGSYEQIGGGS